MAKLSYRVTPFKPTDLPVNYACVQFLDPPINKIARYNKSLANLDKSKPSTADAYYFQLGLDWSLEVSNGNVTNQRLPEQAIFIVDQQIPYIHYPKNFLHIYDVLETHIPLVIEGKYSAQDLHEKILRYITSPVDGLYGLLFSQEWFISSKDRLPYQSSIAITSKDHEIIHDLVYGLDPHIFLEGRFATYQRWQADKDKALAIYCEAEQPADSNQRPMIIAYAVMLRNTLVSIGVIPDYRRQGIATHLLSKCMQYSKSNVLHAFIPENTAYCDGNPADAVYFFSQVKLKSAVLNTKPYSISSIPGILFTFSTGKQY